MKYKGVIDIMAPWLIVVLVLLFLIISFISVLNIRASIEITYKEELSVNLKWLWIN